MAAERPGVFNPIFVGLALLAALVMVTVDARRRPVLTAVAYGMTVFVTVSVALARMPAFAPSLPSVPVLVVAAVVIALAGLAGGALAKRATALVQRAAPDNLGNLTAEMVRLNVDVIVAGNDPAVEAARRATKTIPIIMVQGRDPVGSGFVASLARPGGNITGLSNQTTELASKRLQLLKEAIPDLSRVAVLWDPTEPVHALLMREAEAAAQALGGQIRLVEARSPGALDSARAALTRERPGAVLNLGGAMLFPTEPGS